MYRCSRLLFFSRPSPLVIARPAKDSARPPLSPSARNASALAWRCFIFTRRGPTRKLKCACDAQQHVLHVFFNSAVCAPLGLMTGHLSQTAPVLSRVGTVCVVRRRRQSTHCGCAFARRVDLERPVATTESASKAAAVLLLWQGSRKPRMRRGP